MNQYSLENAFYIFTQSIRSYSQSQEILKKMNIIANKENSEKQKIVFYDFYLKQRDKFKELDWIEQIPIQYFPQQFKNFIKENLVCQICMYLMEQVIELECQHICCNICLRSLKAKCPFCQHHIKPFLIQTSLRSKLLQFYTKQLQVPCVICYEQLLETQAVQKESIECSILNIWNGPIGDLERHFGYHFDENCEGLQQNIDITQKCQYEYFGCKQSFNNYLIKSMHEGVSCEYRWIRCNECIKIYFGKDFQKHNCKPDDFYKSTDHFPKYKQKQNKPKIKLHVFSVDCQDNYFFEQIKRCFLFQHEKPDMNDIRVKSTFMQININEALGLTNLKQQITIKTKQQNTLNLMEKDLQNIQEQIEILQASQKNKIPDYRKSTIFISNLDAVSKYDAVQKLKSNLIQYGLIKSVKIFGVSMSGKYFGVVEFKDQQSAKSLLKQTIFAGCISVGSISFRAKFDEN